MPGAITREADTTDVEEMSLPQAVWIGLCQTLSAVFPGTSRSMSTIAAGQIAGMDRPAALEFSFLLSIPTMIAATVWDLKKEVFTSGGAAHVAMNANNWIVLLIGFAVSFIVALGRGRVVPFLGAQARLYHLRHLPHPTGLGAAVLGNEVHRELISARIWAGYGGAACAATPKGLVILLLLS